MTELIWITAIISVAAVVIFNRKYDFPQMYSHRRIMMDGNLQHVREASGPDPGIVLDMVMSNPFPRSRGDDISGSPVE